MNTWQKIIWLSVLAILLLGGCTASNLLMPTAPPTGGLEGIISNSSTGAPIAGAQVTVAGQAGVFTLTADNEGKYKVTALPAGPYLISVQAAGCYADAIQVGVVANVTSSGNLALYPAEAVAAELAPAPTATPLPTPTAQPTPSPIVVTVVVTPISTQTPVPVSRPPAAAQASIAHTAPALIEPRDESVFVGPRRILFQWTGSCCLAADEYYVVSIPHPQGVEEAWVKSTSWESPDYLYLLVPPSRKLTWNVSVRRHTGQYPNGQWKGPIVSPLSETWSFTWHAGKERSSSPLPTPVSPLPTP